ncbi:D-amino acid dehydrogenase [Verminephrobacter aporrectodeae]|uniref:D-amino acid dehydrogenase n=1 Tax=Verminephrobacter aporrectodeae TaxID=1110389 RepID=UPI0022445C6C|nr:D-amino acid dehydrogenase [Verminephrobacter aporrectodeae]MCW8174124.1 D-amino acid dehydrogenase [Verminephrobacter aporrectodeae subsp. tuberculatae]MCW8201907.1 D-amino acid dehydrogenase [Verminephrobacter aporrectodeae subsp. tuberculatae]
MKVLVLGAGVVGVATAYYLWKNGHEVTVVDRQAGPGMETSFGNAGGICPSFAGPWAAPGMISRVLKLSLQSDSPIRFAPRPDPRQIAWVLQWMRNCTAQRFRANKLCMQRVAHYSYRCLREVLAQAPIHDFDFHAGGVLQLFRTRAELQLGRLSAQAVGESGVPWRLLDADQLAAVEPALVHGVAQVAGALHMPADASGDSHKFAGQLAAHLAQHGVSFRYATRIDALEQKKGAISRVHTAYGAMQADAYVVALGSYAPLLLAPLGLKLPVYPLKGYSVTLPVTDPGQVPTLSVMDEHNKVMISRLGNRLRAAGMAELAGYGLALDPARKDLLLRVVRSWFPEGLDWEHVSFWAGLRPMTPDGPPILGKARWSNLFLNSGHGSNGWTQACGTAKIVSDLVCGRTPEIDMQGLTVQRFGG